MARALLSEKAKVLITGRDQHKIDYLSETLRSFPGEAQGVALDVQSEESVRQGVKRMISLWGVVLLRESRPFSGRRQRVIAWLSGQSTLQQIYRSPHSFHPREDDIFMLDGQPDINTIV
jgi:NAD(P)-dependent dehydrogenase (short-subunit alcohol dehydrogenase family)